MNTALAISAAGALLLSAAFAFAPTREIRTEVSIAAPPSEVWRVLADGGRYGEWNPFIVSMRGKLEHGETLENTMQPEGMKPMTFRPKVLVAEAGRELRWLGRLLAPRIFDGEHYFLLEERDGETRLVHGETFRGVLLWFMGVGNFAKDLERMNAALKARVEAGRSPTA